ncbi:TIGR03960 family B12-binding radical SAM protein [Trichlorobacter lovleyi]|uniref:TIGR03960 family B12-binding radical SAM protein n=1 Tax=Trichlorobacter lovleyi TaxID=313985 RepID=UPI00223F9115|nr:TIGR03960 family B12-binding radical SAM protein [Trichlorobacter lovleyi]QOX77696.1 TIGR03960 family B12-binding radical SAM protein [Trichlorobacter lovleyi]
MPLDLLSVEKPARYMGGEMGSVVKPVADLRIALAFPDVYEVGMSHLGLRILYQILNTQDGIAAERAYTPWPDMAAQMAAEQVSLTTLETATPLAETDIIGFTLQYELSCTNILTMLRQAAIPVRAADRADGGPLIIGGGPGAYNPEPLAPFFDAFLLGDGEEAVLEIAQCVRDWKRLGNSDKQELLAQLAGIPGVYVPSFFNLVYHDDGRVASIQPLKSGYTTVRRRFLPDIEAAAFPDSPIIPFMKTIHDRVAIEVARGCTRGCRFCQAGYIYRPLRERSPQRINELIETSLKNTGYEEISLLSLSTGDYSCIAPLLQELMARHAQGRVAVSLPSLRVGTLTPELIDEIRKVRKTGFTLAPEAGSERMRQVINKGISEQDLLEGAYNIFAAGWRLIKLYFMMGLPTETQDDLQAIPELARQVKNQARRSGGQGEVNVAVSTFVPKPHTPFQWQRQLSLDETRDRQRFLKDEMRRRKLNFKYQDAELSFMEGVIARGDRRLADVLERAVELGACFDGWNEHFSLQRWLQAFSECGIDPNWYLRERDQNELLPWDHLDAGIDKAFLLKELNRAHSEAATPDCRFGACSNCGVCDFKTVANRVVPEQQPALTASGLPATPDAITQRRLRMRFSKTGPIRYLSHLDLINLFTRAVQRAGVPILYSQGFHPHPRFSFATATSVGVESQAEYLDLFVGDIGADEALRRLNQVLPAGIAILESHEVDLKAPSLSPLIEATRYRVTLPGYDPETLRNQCVQFMAQESWVLVRAKKGQQQTIDLRRETRELSANGHSLELTIGRGKAIELTAAITGLTPDALKTVHIEKTSVVFVAY